MRRIISREEAARIALEEAQRRRKSSDSTEPRVRVYSFEQCPETLSIYQTWPDDLPAWVVFVPWFDGQDGKCLRSSHVIIISKVDGRVLYDGDAGDEG